MQHWADYVVFVVFLLVSLSVGLFFACTGKKMKSTSEYILGDRQLRVIPTSISMLVSYQSAIMILGFSNELYTQGSQLWLMATIGITLSIILTERLIVPWLYPLQLTSVYNYFYMRYNNRVIQMFGAFLGILNAIIYSGVSVFAPSVAMETATGVPATVSIPVMMIVCIIYTALGGIKAVVWTDVFQFLTMLTGMLIILIKGSMLVGGLSVAMETAKEEGRLEWANIDPDPTVRHTVWGFLIGWSLNWGSLYAFNQASVQRYSSVTSLEKARLMLLLNIPAVVLLVSMAFMVGVLVFSYYQNLLCDPLAAHRITHGNELLPLFVKDVFSDMHGFNGLFIATLYSGALSSISSSLAGASTIIWDDILRWKFSHWSDKKATIVNKIAVVLSGLLAMAVSFLAALMPGPVSQVAAALLGAIGGPILGMFLISGLWCFRWVNWQGVLVGTVLSFGFNLWITGGAITVSHHTSLPPLSTEGCVPSINITAASAPAVLSGIQKLYTLSYLWYVPVGAALTLLLGGLASGLVYCAYGPDSHDHVTDAMFIPFGQLCSFRSVPTASQSEETLARSDTNLVKSDLTHTRHKSDLPDGAMISISGSNDRFAIADVSTISDGSYCQYNPPLVDYVTHL